MESRGLGGGPSHQELRPDEDSGASEFALKVHQASMLGFSLDSNSAPAPGNHHATTFSQWLPYHSSPASPSKSPRPLEYFPFPAAHQSHGQDSWSPLQITGVPTQSTSYAQPLRKPHHQVGDIDPGYSNCQYSPSSDNDRKYHAFPSSDSGYGSKKGASSVATSFGGVDSSFCSQSSTNEYGQPASALSFNHSPIEDIDGPNDAIEILESPHLYQEMKCDYPRCRWVGKCASDKRYVPCR